MLSPSFFLYLFYLVTTSWGLGFYSTTQAVLVFFLIGFLAVYFKKPSVFQSFLKLKIPIFITTILINALLFYSNWFFYLRHNKLDSFIFTLFFGFSLLAIFYLVSDRIQKTDKFLLIFAIFSFGFFYRLNLIYQNPNPQLDSYQLIKNAPLFLLQNTNPYQEGLSYPLIKLGNGSYFSIPAYSYGVTPLILLLPVDYLLSDPRYLFLLVELLTAVLIYKISKNFLFPYLFYFHPLSLYVITQGFMEPLMLFLLTLALYLILQKFFRVGSVVLAFFVNIKQHLFAFPLFLFKLLPRKFFLLFLFSALLLILPFFLPNPANFLKWGLVAHYIDTNLAPIRHQTLTINSLFWRLFETNLPNWFYLLVWAVTAFFIFKRQKKKISNLLVASSLFYTVVSFFYHFSYTNYFYFASILLLLSFVFEKAGN